MEYTEKYLESLGIFNLRNLARALNVKRPTTKRKDDLIKEILENKNEQVSEKYVKWRSPKGNFLSENQLKINIFEENLKKMAVELDKNFEEMQESLNILKESYQTKLKEYVRKFFYELNNYCLTKEEIIKILSEELDYLRENGF